MGNKHDRYDDYKAYSRMGAGRTSLFEFLGGLIGG